MKIWVDDIRTSPDNTWTWIKSVRQFNKGGRTNVILGNVSVISLDHDAGEYYKDGGDYMKIIDWMDAYFHDKSSERVPKLILHTQNPVAKERMQQVIMKNGWDKRV